MWPQPNSTLLPEVRRQKGSRLLPALAAVSQSEVQANLTGALKCRGKVGGAITLFLTHLQCNGEQERERKSSENRDAQFSGV